MKRFSSLLITIFILVACQSQADVTETIPANTATAEVTLTSTTQPTTPPQATPTQTLSVEFPDWVKNPDTQILLVPVGTQDKGYENMALFNAETGERFDIPFTEEVGDYFWLPDISGFGFLDKEQIQVIIFSIQENIATIIPIHKEALRFLSQDDDWSEPIQVSLSNITDSTFLLISFWQSLSSDRKYFIYQEGYDDMYTSILDIASSQIIYISDPNDEFFDLYSEWSPNSEFLAISQADEEPGNLKSFEILPNFRLQVYEVHSKQLIASYKNVTFPNWSPDGTKFLFQEWKELDNWVWYGQSPPCVFDTISGITNCYNETLIYPKMTFSSLQWSPDQSMIGYIYFDVIEKPYKERGGFCLIIISSNDLNCLLSDFGVEDQKIIDYAWSPDNNYISLQYDTYCPHCDERDNPQLAIANIKTGEYFLIGDNIHFIYQGLWRPSPNP